MAMRAFFKPFARHAAHSPIETIVFFSVIGTLAYFHLLSTIKHSAFLAPSSSLTLRSTHAILRNREWVAVSDAQWVEARSTLDDTIFPFELQQLIFSFDTTLKYKDVSKSLSSPTDHYTH